MKTADVLVEPTQNEDFGQYCRHVQTLLELIPTIRQAVSAIRAVSPVEGWRSMEVRFRAFLEQGAEPVIVAVLYGPTGAGKSAWFRRWTGVPVPSSNGVRPVTRWCVMAVPESVYASDRVSGLFPGLRVEHLDGADEQELAEVLQTSRPDDGRVFSVGYRMEGATSELPLILVDAPDFNAVEKANWKRAKEMLDRAEVVIFTVQGDAYATREAVAHLAQCCQAAGLLVYLFTKTSYVDARTKWEDLVGKLGSDAWDMAHEWGRCRDDGRSLVDFLGSSYVFCSPLAEEAPLDAPRPLRDEWPSLDSLLRGQDARRVVLQGLLASTAQAVESCENLVCETALQREELVQAMEQVRTDVKEAAYEIAGGEFPLGEFVRLTVEVVREQQNWIVQALSYPLTLTHSATMSLARRFLEWVRSGDEDGRLANRIELEQKKLQAATERLIDRWRSRFSEEAKNGRMLDASRCAKLRDALSEAPLPPPLGNWKESVREDLRSWCQKHWVIARVFAAAVNVVALAGLTAIVVDLAMDGGLIAGLGLTAMAGAGGIGAAALMGWLKKLHLDKAAQTAHEAWRRMRAKELAEHLCEHFSDPLFEPWMHLIDTVDSEDLRRCKEACLGLRALGAQAEIR